VVPSSRWPYEATFRAISYVFRVRTDLPDAARLIPELFEPFACVEDLPPDASYELTRSEGSDPNPFMVTLGGEVAFRTVTALGVVDELLWHVNREALGRAHGYLAVHASAAGRGTHAVVLPASQDAGKSTTVAGLVRSGLTYLTDEGALFRSGSGLLDPYPKPLWLSPESVLALGDLRDRVMPEYRDLNRMRTYVRGIDLGSPAAPASCRVSLIVTPRFLPGAPTTLEPLSRAATLMCLARNAFNLRECGRAGIGTLRTVVESAPGYRLVFGGLGDAVRTITRLFDDVTAGEHED
jgi:hypothetical protein